MDRQELRTRFQVETASEVHVYRGLRKVRVMAATGAERVYRGLDRSILNDLSHDLAGEGWHLVNGRGCHEAWRRS